VKQLLGSDPICHRLDEESIRKGWYEITKLTKKEPANGLGITRKSVAINSEVALLS